MAQTTRAVARCTCTHSNGEAHAGGADMVEAPDWPGDFEEEGIQVNDPDTETKEQMVEREAYEARMERERRRLAALSRLSRQRQQKLYHPRIPSISEGGGGIPIRLTARNARSARDFIPPCTRKMDVEAIIHGYHRALE